MLYLPGIEASGILVAGDGETGVVILFFGLQLGWTGRVLPVLDEQVFAVLHDFPFGSDEYFSRLSCERSKDVVYLCVVKAQRSQQLEQQCGGRRFL